MKYIRTKDGRTYKVLTQYKNGIFGCECKELPGRELPIHISLVLNQADTIEELCDGWIIECPEWDKPTFKKRLQYMNWQDYVETANKHKAIHYAAIFVRLPNGAIRIEPVAKMNDKGELELL